MPHKLHSKILAIASLAISLLAWPAAGHAQDLGSIPFQDLPRFSDAPIGQGHEPVSFVYIGTEDQIIRLYIDHGWNGADPISPSSLLQAYRAARDNAPYPTAPFTPAYINGQKQDLSFQLPTEANTIAQRHHTRIWLTNTETSDGRMVWVGTASLDVSIATSGQTILPVHHIDPNLAAERSFIIDNLQASDVTYVQYSDPQNGLNSFGDPYTFDGIAAVIDLGGGSSAAPAATTEPTVTPEPTPTADIDSFTTAAPSASNVDPNSETTMESFSTFAHNCFRQMSSFFRASN